VEDQGMSFTVRFDARHRQREIDFAWRGTIAGAPDGTIRYTMDGLCQAAFGYAKIGICIHHPIREDAGRPFTGHAPDGPISGTLPQTIGPQVHLDDGTDLPLFTPVDDLRIELAGGLTVHFAFEGDLFEMEDQRNWTDASFKTASTPASLGYVHHAAPGQRIRQSVTVAAAGHSPGRAVTPPTLAEPAPRTRIPIGEPLGRGLPPVGLGMASHGSDLSPREVDLLRQLHLGHLRADLHLDDPAYPGELRRAIAACRALECGLELAVFLGEQHEPTRLAELAALLGPPSVPVRRVLVFGEGEEVAAGRWVREVRERLSVAAPEAAFCGGTNVYFNELNRNRPEIGAMDGVTYSINPQIHAFDEASLTEALEGQAETVASARAFCGDLPVIVSPITLKPRFNAVATVAEAERAPDELPAQVDPRQMSLFGAAWTLGSFKRLAEAGAGSLTYYETTGWRGVMETAAGSPPAAPFPSEPGMVFPLYHVFADLGEYAASGTLLACPSSAPLAVNALAVRASVVHVLVANMTPDEQRVTLGPLEAFPPQVTVRRLNDETALLAMREPETYRAQVQTLAVAGGELSLTLAPFELVRIDTAM
jgi:hypothetical protein